MRKLNNPAAIVDDYRNQAGTGGKNCFFLVFLTPIHVQFWDPFRDQVKGKDLRKLLNPQWTTGHRETLQKSIRVLPVCIVDLV